MLPDRALASEISSKLPLVIGIVLVLSFFLLLLAFRSLLVPLKAVW
jgi:RND superfamily putative drug exporter